MLDDLLSTIQRDLVLPCSVEVVVVDNDGKRSAREIVDKHAEGNLPIRYFVEPEQNISVARNRTVAEARGTWLAMIDDDECPDPDWLDCLFRCAQSLDADAVFGPVNPIFTSGCPPWVIEGGFFEKGAFATGTEVIQGQTRTSNVLLRSDLIKNKEEEPFDVAFGLSGGEDVLLFGKLLREGRRFFWCEDAVVSEHIPAERATWRWLLLRSFQCGQNYGRLVLSGSGHGRPSIAFRTLYFFWAILQGCVAAVLWIATLAFGRKRSFRWLRVVSTQVGKASATTTFVYRGYARLE